MNANDNVDIYIVSLASSYHAVCFNCCDYLLGPSMGSLIFEQ
jgi:hypothetical protein